MKRVAAFVQRWHPGQLIVFWVALALAALLLVWRYDVIENQISQWRDLVQGVTYQLEAQGANPGPEGRAQANSVSRAFVNRLRTRQRAIAVVALVIIPYAGLATTWIWFGGRVARRADSPGMEPGPPAA